MPIIVQKYGGSSVADVGKLKYVAERVMQTMHRGHQVVVVVSAMGDTTDELLTMAKRVSANPDRRELDMLVSTFDVSGTGAAPAPTGAAQPAPADSQEAKPR